ncbi:MAG: hypothetical protein K1X55_11920 [Chitinophagales bacterium]|nr:hypothetical protein [Chitinophagales bacterium]
MTRILTTLKWIHPDKEITNKESHLFTVIKVSLILILPFFVLFPALGCLILLALAFVFGMWGIKNIRKEIEEEASFIIGYLIFTDDKVMANAAHFGSREINMDEVSNITIHSNYVKDMILTRRGPVNSGLGNLYFSFKDGTQVELKFFIDKIENYIAFIQVMKTWYKRGIVIQEYYGEQRQKTILLKLSILWKYQELQLLKQELGINAFYKG